MILKLDHIYKDYIQGKMVVPVLKDVCLHVDEGEYVAIMGPSGSGKSTLMNIVGCLDRPTSGSYELAGENVLGRDDKDMAHIRLHNLGFVFQNFQLLPRQSALENVCLPLVYAGVKKKERIQRGMEALKRVGLEDRMYFKPTQLSGGQKQRVAIARAMVNRPKILLADEPTGALDSKSSIQLMELFGELNQEGVTIIMITHAPEIAGYAKRVVDIFDGELSERGGIRMKIRTVVISLVVTAGLAGGIAYGVRYAMQAGKKPVDVVPVANVNYGFWGDTNTMSGNIISRDTQTVQIDIRIELVKVYVETGDTVKRGDPLLEYDMTLTELQREMENLTKQSLEIDLASQQKALEKLQNTTPTASLEVNDGVMTASDELLLEEDPAAGGQGSGGAPAGTGNGGSQGGGNGPALISDGGGDTSGDLILDEAPSVSPGAPAGEIIIEDNSQSGSQAGTAGESETAPGDTAETEPEIPEQTESETSGAEQTESESDSVLEDPETEPETQTEDSLLTDDSETPEGDEMTELDQETVIKAVNAFLTRVSQLSSQELDSLIASDISEALRIYREQLSVVREQELEGLDVLGERRVVRSYSLNPSVASIVGEGTAQVLTQAYERACFYQFVYCMEQLKPGNMTVEQPEETPEEPAEGENGGSAGYHSGGDFRSPESVGG